MRSYFTVEVENQLNFSSCKLFMKKWLIYLGISLILRVRDGLNLVAKILYLLD